MTCCRLSVLQVLVLQVPNQPIVQRIQEMETTELVMQGWVMNGIKCLGEVQSNEVNLGVSLEDVSKNLIEVDEGTCCWASWSEGKLITVEHWVDHWVDHWWLTTSWPLAWSRWFSIDLVPRTRIQTDWTELWAALIKSEQLFSKTRRCTTVLVNPWSLQRLALGDQAGGKSAFGRRKLQ